MRVIQAWASRLMRSFPRASPLFAIEVATAGHWGDANDATRTNAMSDRRFREGGEDAGLAWELLRAWRDTPPPPGTRERVLRAVLWRVGAVSDGELPRSATREDQADQRERREDTGAERRGLDDAAPRAPAAPRRQLGSGLRSRRARRASRR